MRRQQPLDAETMALAQNLARAARRSGADIVEALHEAGLILSPQRRVAIQHATLNYLLDRLDDIRPAEMMRRARNSAQTPRVMYDTMVEFIEEYKRTLGE